MRKTRCQGLYAKARRGEIKNFTGIDSPYELPDAPEKIIRNINIAPEEAVDELFEYLNENKSNYYVFIMKKPATLVGVDVFIPDSESRVLLINGLTMVGAPRWLSDLGETPENAEFGSFETRFEIKINRLLGVFSSLKYESVNYPWKGREYLHCFFMVKSLRGWKPYR